MREARGGEASHVLVLATLGAPQRRLVGSRRSRPAAPEPEPTPVATARATVIDATPVPAAEAERWLRELDDAAQDAVLAQAAAVLNRAVQAHRLAAADPTVQDVAVERALVARLGHGNGDQVAEGRWDSAVEVPVDRRRRRQRRDAALRPQERIAALLGGRDESLACELLALRARGDLAAGRVREAALQLRVALEAGIAELEGADTAVMPERVAELRELRGAVGVTANAAVRGDLDATQVADVEHALARLEAALRARSAAGFD